MFIRLAPNDMLILLFYDYMRDYYLKHSWKEFNSYPLNQCPYVINVVPPRFSSFYFFLSIISHTSTQVFVHEQLSISHLIFHLVFYFILHGDDS